MMREPVVAVESGFDRVVKDIDARTDRTCAQCGNQFDKLYICEHGDERFLACAQCFEGITGSPPRRDDKLKRTKKRLVKKPRGKYKPRRSDVKIAHDALLEMEYCEWLAEKRENKLSKIEWQRELRHEMRNELLKSLVPDRRCPKCGQVKIRTKQWVVVEGVATCLGCHRREKNAQAR